MFVKQIDVNKALELASKGIEVFIMAPSTPAPEKWTDYEPDTLQNMLDGMLFFRREAAMEMETMDLGDGLPDTPAKPSGGAKSENP